MIKNAFLQYIRGEQITEDSKQNLGQESIEWIEQAARVSAAGSARLKADFT